MKQMDELHYVYLLWDIIVGECKYFNWNIYLQLVKCSHSSIERKFVIMVKINNNFSAATDTSRITLLWLFIYVTRNPECQNKIQEEIDNVIGMFQFPSKL